MLEQKVEAFLKRKQVSLQSHKCLIGVSGGPDSLALLHYFWNRREKNRMVLAVAHLDHMFRGQESAMEAEFVQFFCEERNIPVFVKQANVPLFMKETGYSSQEAARKCRYDFYLDVLKNEELDTLILGHHGDDQVETILMRLTRGSTGKARIGIPFLRGFEGKQIIRPLLAVTKDEIEDYCLRHQLQPVYDSSNKSRKYSRNRFRHSILPFLKKENPKVHEHFQRFSEELEEDEQFLEELANQLVEEVIKEKMVEKVTIDRKALTEKPMPLQRRAIKLILNYLYEQQPNSLSATHIDQIISLLKHSEPSGQLDLPEGLKVTRSYNDLLIGYQVGKPKDSYILELQLGDNLLVNGDLLSMEYVQGEKEYTNMNQLLLPISHLSLPLKVRSRKTGDRMSIKGMKGSKKVKDIFIDQKIPRDERQLWPIVTDSNDQVLWIPGLKKSQFLFEELTDRQQYILLQYKKH